MDLESPAESKLCLAHVNWQGWNPTVLGEAAMLGVLRPSTEELGVSGRTYQK